MTRLVYKMQGKMTKMIFDLPNIILLRSSFFNRNPDLSVQVIKINLEVIVVGEIVFFAVR